MYVDKFSDIYLDLIIYNEVSPKNIGGDAIVYPLCLWSYIVSPRGVF